MVNKWRRQVQYLATFSVSLASLTLGLSSGWPSPVIPKLMNNETNIEITRDEIAVMAGMSSPGFMIGSLVSVYAADNLGRRTAVLASAVPMALGTLIIAFAVKPWLLYVTRILWGIGGGMSVSTVAMYVTEIADKEIRGTLFVSTRVMFNLGCLIIFAIGPFASYKVLNYLLLGAPICYFVACLWIPESPYYCLKDGKVDAARKELTKLLGVNDELAIEKELDSMRANVKREMKSSSSAWELFSQPRYRKAVIITAGLKMCQILTGSLTIQHYLGYIMKESRANLSLATVLIVFGAVKFVVGIMSSVLVDRVGRRPLLFFSYLGTAVSNTIVGVYFFLKEVIQVNEESLAVYGFIPFAGIIASNVISTLGYQSLTYAIPAEMFPMNVKAVALTSTSILGGALSFVLGIVFQKLIDIAGFACVFAVFAGVAYVGSVFVFFVLPETKGLSFNEIQILVQGKYYVNDDDLQLNNVAKDDVKPKGLG